MQNELVFSIVAGVLIGIFVDRILFLYWHRVAHSKKLLQEEKEQKEKEDIDNQELKKQFW